MKICIIGVSGHTNYVSGGINDDPEAEITGLAPGSKGENIDSLYQKVKNIGYSPEKYNDYREMLDKEKPDLAVVACHFGDHARIGLEVIKRGIDTFIEKPIATTLDDLGQMKKAYDEVDINLAAMFGIRYQSDFLTAWHVVQEGAIGEVRLMNAQKSYRLGSRNDFYKNRETYGGTIPWVGSHAIDWLHWFSGEDFKSVFASHSTKNNRGHGDLEMTALCHFKFSNEVYGSVNIDYLRPDTAPSHGDDRIRVAGTKGVIEVRGGKVYLINSEAKGNREIPLMAPGQIFADFLKQVRGEDECLVSAEDSFLITEACLKARQSADEEKVIYFE